MKELKKKPGPLDAPKLPKLPKLVAAPPARTKAGSGEQALGQLAGPEAVAQAGAIPGEYLTHPANAEPTAELFGQLQRSHGNAYVQRMVEGLATPGSGQNLDASTRAEMESAFGEDFSQVRVHTDAEAERATETVDARAMTHGKDIYFNTGEYDPSSRAGKEALAHELTHVMQQKGGVATAESGSIDRPGDTFEQEANQTAALVARGEPVRVEKQAGAPAHQRKPIDGKQAAPPSAVVSASVSIDLMASPSGTLPNGVRYRLLPGDADYSIDLVMPSGISFTVASRNRHRTLYVTGDSSVSRGETVAIVEVTEQRGQSAEVEITFTQGSGRVVVTFDLPRRPRPEAAPRPPGGR